MSAREKLRAISDGEIDLPEELKTKKKGHAEQYDELDDFKAATLPRHVKINRENSSTQLQVKGSESGKSTKTQKKGKWKPMKLMVKYWEQYILGKKQYPLPSSATDPETRGHHYEKKRNYVKAKDLTRKQEISKSDSTGKEEVGIMTKSREDSPSLYGGGRVRTPGLCGLNNLGNTCFMNAIVQCLSNTDALAEYFIIGLYKRDLQGNRNKRNSRKFGSKGEITEQLALLLKSLWSFKDSSKLSRDFKNIVSEYGTQYKGSNQHDAQEFLMWLLDKVHEDMNIATKKKYKPRKTISSKSLEVLADEAQANYMRYNNSFVYDLFQAQYRSSLKCPNCLRQRNTFEPYLCVSLPLPQRNLRLVKVIVVYGNQIPAMVQVCVSLEGTSHISDVRQAIAKQCSIAVTQLVLTEVYINGFQRSFWDDQSLSEIHDGDHVYAVETPHNPQGINACVKPTVQGVHCNGPVDETVYLVLLNKDRGGVQGKRFGHPVAIEASRNLNYLQLQRVILKHFGVRQPDAALTQGPVFKLVVVDNVGTTNYISPDEGRPLCTELVERMITLSSDEGGPAHVKIHLEWEVDIKDCLAPSVLNEDIVEDESVQKEKEALEEPVNGTLADCFKLYTQEEELSGDDAWHCPYCKKLQHGTRKKLGLWSLPDVLVIHLKRFKQTGTRRRKLLNLIDFPTDLLDMSPYLEKKDLHAAASSTFRSLSSWSPWKRNSHNLRNCDSDNLYKLYAVCNHIGSTLSGGHYTATCKNPVDSNWYLYDDAEVTEMAEDKIVTPSAYLLFYQRSNLTIAPRNSDGSTSNLSVCDHWAFKMPQCAISGSLNSRDDLSFNDNLSYSGQVPKDNEVSLEKTKPFVRRLRSQSLRLPRKKSNRTSVTNTANLSDGETDTETELLVASCRDTEPGITSRLSKSMNVESRMTSSKRNEGAKMDASTYRDSQTIKSLQTESVAHQQPNSERVMSCPQDLILQSISIAKSGVAVNHLKTTEPKKNCTATSQAMISESHL
ncbi:ubiquitin carboxyl-terminal hydrolase 31-like [Ptychodera flava]|uniref:ubiquitin carboxyl-terminal hydrolase 31-like n=1 Tax=Ptychodera flava TaxID=63121 RepID=UPI003969D3DC